MIITAGYIVLAAGVVITTITAISAHKNKYKEKTAELKMIENAGYTKSYEAEKKSNIYRDSTIQKNPSKLRGLSKKSRQILDEIEKEKNEGPVRDTNYEKDILKPLEAKKNNKKYEIKVKTGTDVLITASSENLDKDSRTSSTTNPNREEKSEAEKNKKEKTEEKIIINNTEVLQASADNNTEVLTVKKEEGTEVLNTLPKESTEVLQNTDKNKDRTGVLEAVREEGTGVLNQKNKKEKNTEGTDILRINTEEVDNGTGVLKPLNEEAQKLTQNTAKSGTEVLTNLKQDKGTAVLDMSKKEEGTAVLDIPPKAGTAVLKVKSTENTGVLTTHDQKEGTAVLTTVKSEEGTGVLTEANK